MAKLSAECAVLTIKNGLRELAVLVEYEDLGAGGATCHAIVLAANDVPFGLVTGGLACDTYTERQAYEFDRSAWFFNRRNQGPIQTTRSVSAERLSGLARDILPQIDESFGGREVQGYLLKALREFGDRTGYGDGVDLDPIFYSCSTAGQIDAFLASLPESP